jgi:hypothetical protein
MNEHVSLSTIGYFLCLCYESCRCLGAFCKLVYAWTFEEPWRERFDNTFHRARLYPAGLLEVLLYLVKSLKLILFSLFYDHLTDLNGHLVDLFEYPEHFYIEESPYFPLNHFCLQFLHESVDLIVIED